ncbi:MAG TPA: ABC transporter ATP-binding protein [Nocardioidaceae bacterium]|nr:ABC transporter ATP-binding protein [Nocardioidaceae bacterium]
MNDDIVVTDRLSKTYGRRPAVADVSLTVRRGEVYGFLGPNGAGKTTTLRMLMGLVRPTGGTARILGGGPGDPAVLRRVGSLIEGPGFYPYLSGRDNLRVLARYNRIDDREVEEALAQVELRERGADRFKSYSLGMKQRLGVAAAMLGDPDLLILDEPTNGLDPAGMADMRALLRRVVERGQTVLLSSHLLGEVQQTCDRVGVISGGHLLVESTVADLRGESAVLVRAEPVAEAARTAGRLYGESAVSVDDDGALRVRMSTAHSAELTTALVHAGVAVREVRPVERTLEEVFFDLTDSNPNKPDDAPDGATLPAEVA